MKTRTLVPVVAVLFAAFALIPSLQAQPLVTIETVTVGDAGNVGDTRTNIATLGKGAVGYEFLMGKYEVTIQQYAQFLNSVASVVSDGVLTNVLLLDLWNPGMSEDASIAGIDRFGQGTQEDPFVYTVAGPRGIYRPIGARSPGNRPITYVSFDDAVRFCNWLHNGATNGADTEDGAYARSTNFPNHMIRKPNAKWWIPNEDEWYKAAYFKGGHSNAGYWSLPVRFDDPELMETTLGGGSRNGNFANGGISSVVDFWSGWLPDQNYLTEVGAFYGSPSPYGTFDQLGNVSEYTERLRWPEPILNRQRQIRGGSFQHYSSFGASDNGGFFGGADSAGIGFRVAGATPNSGGVPRISSIRFSTNGFSILWDSSTAVHVQRTTSLGSRWQTISSSNTTGSFRDPTTPASSAFYRLAVPE